MKYLILIAIFLLSYSVATSYASENGKQTSSHYITMENKNGKTSLSTKKIREEENIEEEDNDPYRMDLIDWEIDEENEE